MLSEGKDNGNLFVGTAFIVFQNNADVYNILANEEKDTLSQIIY
jgi:hypothetical protein